MGAFATIIGPVFEGLTKLVGDFHMSPEEKVQAQQAIADAQLKAQSAAQDYNVQLNSIAGQNIREDAGTGDKARPYFMYIIEAILAFNYLGIPALHAFGKTNVAPMELPTNLLSLFGVCILGYVTNRTAALPGDSQMSMLGGLVKVGNKS